MSDNKKEQIVEAALKRFSHFGYQKTSMSEIADDLRITKANLYYYYPDKAALVKDCAQSVIEEIGEEEDRIVEHYEEQGLIKTIFSMYELHARYMKKYYMLSLYDQLELIKDLGLSCINERYERRHQENLCLIFQKAVDNKEILMNDIKTASLAFYEISEGLAMLHKINDVISGIPNKENIDLTLESQKRAAQFILEGKLLRKQA